MKKAAHDLEKDSRRSLNALGNLVETLTPWLLDVGSWFFAGMIAFDLVIISWWMGIVLLGMMILSTVLVIVVMAHSLPPESEAERTLKRRYQQEAE